MQQTNKKVTLDLTPIFVCWFGMLIMGSLHSVWSNVPAIGWWTAVLWTVGFYIVYWAVRKLLKG